MTRIPAHQRLPVTACASRLGLAARRVLAPLAIAASLVVVLTGCGGGSSNVPSIQAASPTAAASSTPAASPTAVASPTISARPTASASAPPEFSSTTEPAKKAPAGAIAVGMAGPPPHYLPNDLTTRTGATVFFVANTSRGTHNIAIGRGPLTIKLGRATNVPLALSGNVPINTTVTYSVDKLPAGTYLFWCTISDHAQEGMTGTLTVTP